MEVLRHRFGLGIYKTTWNINSPPKYHVWLATHTLEDETDKWWDWDIVKHRKSEVANMMIQEQFEQLELVLSYHHAAHEDQGVS